jgi:hypothetical protein
VKEDVRIAKVRVGALARSSQDRVGATTSLADPATSSGLKMVVNPPNMSRTLRNVGAVLLVSPDPFTGVPGAALLGASYLIRSREAANLQSLARETARTARTIRELQSFL